MIIIFIKTHYRGLWSISWLRHFWSISWPFCHFMLQVTGRYL